jgi:hypothetical protein
VRTAAFDYFGDEGWLDLNSSYTYGRVASRVLSDRRRATSDPERQERSMRPDQEDARPSASSPLTALTRFLTAESDRSFRFACLALTIVVSSIGVLLLWQGASPITGPWDVAILLDGGWRIFNGQVPHRDFHNPIGPLTYLLVALGMKMGRPSTSSIPYGSGLALAVLVPWAWSLARRRLPAAISLLFGLFVALLLAAPRPLGYPISETTYAMLYNRQGYALLSILLIGLLIPSRTGSRATDVAGGVSCGALVALLLYCKMTYFIVGSAGVVVGMVLFRRSLAWLIGFMGGFGLVCLAFAALLDVSLSNYASDILAAARSQSAPMRLRLLSSSLRNGLSEIYLLVLFSAFAATIVSRRTRPTLANARAWIVLVFLVSGSQVIGMGNSAQGGGVEEPLFAVALVILLEHYRRDSHGFIETAADAPRLLYTLALAIGLPLLGGGTFGRDAASLAYTAGWHVLEKASFDASRRLHSASLSEFLVPASTEHVTAYWLARDHPANVNDGIDLLRKHVTAKSRVSCLALANPFSFALELPPVRGEPLWWDLNLSFDRSTYAVPESFLTDATLVMLPRLNDRSHGCCFETVEVMERLYGPYLEEHFVERDRSSAWILFARR